MERPIYKMAFQSNYPRLKRLARHAARTGRWKICNIFEWIF